MVKSFILNQIDALKGIKNKAGIISVCAILLFFFLNAFKITLFNFYIIPTQTMEAFKYKLTMSILLVLIIYPVILSIRSKIVFIALYILQAVYILANISYYLYYHSYLNILQWFALFNEGFLAVKNFSAPMSAKMLVAFIDLPVFLFIAIKYSNIYNVKKKLHFYRLATIAISLLIIVHSQVSIHAKGNFITTLMKDKYKGESPIVQWYGTVANNIASLFLAGNESQLISCFKYGNDLANDKDSGDKPNFVIIQVESMDSSVISTKYKDTHIAPYLNSLAEENIFYPYVMSYHKGGATSDCEFSIINSIETLDGFPAIKLTSYQYPNSMLKMLSNSSYKNVAFHGNTGVFFNRDSAFPKMGFDEFYDMKNMGLKHAGWGAPDKEVFNFAAKTIKKLEQPYLAYIITMTSHGPFVNARNYYNNSMYDDIQNETVRNYFNSMSYVDESINSFVTDIRANCKNTYIFIIGDHTPSINTSTYKQASFTMDGRYFEFVPLIIITPDNKKYKEDKRVASFLDISPTILYSSGVPFDIKSDGQDLINPAESFNKIPFKGDEFDRTYLFNVIKD